MTGTEIELSRHELHKWMARAVSDSGFFGRELLGYNYDLDHLTGRKFNVGKGGLSDNPPFRTMTSFLERADKPLCVLLGPRFSLKSVSFVADCGRWIFGHPDDSLLYASGTDDQVLDKSIAIRSVFEHNETIHQCWSDLWRENNPDLAARGFTLNSRTIRTKGSWGKRNWTLSIRKDKHDLNPTLSTMSLRRMKTGGHYHRGYLDDLIDWRNCRSPDQIELAKFVLKMVMPLMLPGSKLMVGGTLYHPSDLYSWIQGLPGWEKLILGCGFEVYEKPDGLYGLRGSQIFPSLTKEFLERQLGTMSFQEFCSQYLMRHVLGAHQVFKREWLKPISLTQAELSQLTTWILTDTATSMKRDACLSVLFVVGLDQERRIYLLDCVAGRMETGEIVDNLFTLHQVWGQRTQMTGVTLEKAFTDHILNWIRTEERKRGLRLNMRPIPRGMGEQNKDGRIMRLEPRMRAGDLYVNDTMPKTYRLDGRPQVLWDPQGFVDSNTQDRQPSGELVDQFIGFPYLPPNRKDMVDALADIEHQYRNGEMACYNRRAPAAFTYAPSIQRRGLDQRGGVGQDWLRGLGPAPPRR